VQSLRLLDERRTLSLRTEPPRARASRTRLELPRAVCVCDLGYDLAASPPSGPAATGERELVGLAAPSRPRRRARVHGRQRASTTSCWQRLAQPGG
jgi:hypothetical protein